MQRSTWGRQRNLKTDGPNERNYKNRELGLCAIAICGIRLYGKTFWSFVKYISQKVVILYFYNDYHKYNSMTNKEYCLHFCAARS